MDDFDELVKVLGPVGGVAVLLVVLGMALYAKVGFRAGASRRDSQ